MGKWLTDAFEKKEKEGKLTILAELVKEKILSLQQAATSIGMSVEQLLAGFKEYNLVL